MLSSFRLPALLALLIATLASLSSAYRPVQFVKHTGQSGRADQAFSMVNYFNETTQQSDLFVRMWMFRYGSSSRGWAALGVGPRMQGSLMFIIYGDPAAPGGDVTLTVRTVDGHHPPRPLAEERDYYTGEVPEVEIVKAQFEDYAGNYYSDLVKAKPSHIGVADFIVRGYEKWTAAELPLSNDSTSQAMIWSSNFKQDYQGDFSADRAIDMHQFGLGFGFVWVDLKNALSPLPFFGDIHDMQDHTGVNEIGDPAPPTDQELLFGQEALFAQGYTGGAPPPPAAEEAVDKDTSTSTETPGPDHGNEVEEPVKTVKQWNIRSLMWHLHGGLMTLSFLVLYPLGVFFLRSARPTAFNLHWTLNSLSSMSVGVASIIGFVNSHSISIAHQYLGVLVVCALAAQTVLGWRHHVVYTGGSGSGAAGRRTWMSQVHVVLGRVVLPVGMLNVVLGLLLRSYGWLTISLTIALAVVELVLLTLIVGRARSRARRSGPTLHKGPNSSSSAAIPLADDAEEYFQLTGEDDEDDEFSDNEHAGLAANDEERARRQQDKDDQQKRLAKLDRV